MTVWVLLGGGLALWLAYYCLRVARKPTLSYKPNALTDSYVRQSRLLNRPYWVTPWLVNRHLQLLLLGLKKGFAPKLDYDRCDRLEAPDGGSLAIEWLGLDLPEDRPTLVLLHTISGSAHSMRGFVRHIHQALGWRVAVCIRRGHSGLPLTAPKFNTMGCSKDFRLQLQHIQTAVPESPLCAVGVSAGSGVLARYLGEVGGNTPIRAAVAYCPGYDLETAFQRSMPFYSRMMAKKLIRTFLEGEGKHFGHLPGYQEALRSKDLDALHKNLYGTAGFESYADYVLATNPMLGFENIQVPTLVINAKDDPVCHIDNAYEHMAKMQGVDQMLLVMTERGSHCAFFEGFRAKSWGNALIAEYLQHQMDN